MSGYKNRNRLRPEEDPGLPDPDFEARQAEKAAERESDRQRRQEEQLKAARKRETFIVGGIIGVLLIAVIAISLLTKDTNKELLKPEPKTSETEEESTTEKETVIDIAGKNSDIYETTKPSERASQKESDSSTEEEEAVIPAEEMTDAPETEAQEEPETAPAPPETAPPETAPEAVEPPASPSVNVPDQITIPSWITQDFLQISPRNRPGIALPAVHDIVVHWVANPGTTAKGNRDYFNDLSIPEANLEDVSASAHFVVGLAGEIIQCVPVAEVAYANYPRNYDTISIEVCHPDWDGKYSDVTYGSLIRLISYLCEQYGLNADHVIRHHDVSGKDCPKYYVLHPEAWEQLRHDVTVYISQHPDIGREFP